MPRYGRDFDRSRFDPDRMPERGYRGRGDWQEEGYEGMGGRYGARRPEGHGYGGFDEDSPDELSGYGSGGGAYDADYESGFRGDRYGGPGMGGYMAGSWGGRGYEGREERDLGGYERGFGGGQRGPWGGRPMGGSPRGTSGFGRDGFGERGGYESFGESRGGRFGGGAGRGGNDELRRLRAADIMTENPECVTPEVSLADAARKMRDLDVGIIPVVESEGNRRLRGVITDRDIAIRAVADGRDANSTRVSEVMTTSVETCNKNDPVQNVLRVMEREQVRRVPITDREGRLVGIVAQADVATELDEDRSEHRVANTLERISEPGSGSRGGQGRGGRGSMSATHGRTSMGGGEGTAGPQGEPRGGQTSTNENI